MSRRHRVSPEDIRRARDVPLLPLVEGRGYALVKDGRYYRLAEHDSLVIDPQRNRWHWNSQGITNANAIDWLMTFERYTFTEAVYLLIGRIAFEDSPAPVRRAASKDAAPPPLPPAHSDTRRAYAYLTATRQLNPELVRELIRDRLIYEDAQHHNVVFVRHDEAGIAAGFFCRSTLTGSSYMYEPPHSDKRWTFLLRGEDTRVLYVAESAIDACSVETLRRRQGLPANRYPILSLGGNSTVAFRWYVEQHPPDVVVCCTDNDTGGESGYQAVAAMYDGTLVRACPPLKDWNAVCQSEKTDERLLPFAQIEKEIDFYEKP